MEMNKTTIGVLATLCISAGAGGAYLVTRSDRPAPASASAEDTAVAEPETPPVRVPVIDDAAQPLRRPDLTSEAARPQAPRDATRRAVSPAPEATPEPEAVVEAAVASRALTPELDAPAIPAGPLGAQSVAPTALTPVRPPAPEPVRAVEPPSPEFAEFVVATDSVVGLQVETLTTSDNAHVEDEVIAHVTRDVRVGNRVVIPAGAVARGEVTLVERGGRLRDRAQLGVRFTLVVLADGTRIPIDTDMIYREGDSRGAQSASRIGGGAIGGAIIGGILGGKRGAAIGGSVGAGAGTAAALAGSRDPAVLPRGATVTVRITAPTTVILPVE